MASRLAYRISTTVVFVIIPLAALQGAVTAVLTSGGAHPTNQCAMVGTYNANNGTYSLHYSQGTPPTCVDVGCISTAECLNRESENDQPPVTYWCACNSGPNPCVGKWTEQSDPPATYRLECYREHQCGECLVVTGAPLNPSTPHVVEAWCECKDS